MYHVNLYLLESELRTLRERTGRRARRLLRDSSAGDPYTPWLLDHRDAGVDL